MEWELAAPYDVESGPLGLTLPAHMHPIDGDAGRVAELAAKLGGVSEQVREQIGRLQELQAGEFWVSSAGSAEQFQEAIDDLPEQLEPVATRYQRVAEALEAFHPVLAETKADAEYWIQVAADARDEVERAEAGVEQMESFNEEAERAAEDANDEREDGDPPVEADGWGGPPYDEMLAEAREKLEQAVENTRQAVREFMEAAQACSDAVHDAGDDDLKNDSGIGAAIGGAFGGAFGAMGDAFGDATGWVSDRWDDAVEFWDEHWDDWEFVRDIARTIGTELLQAALVVLEVATLPLIIPLGAVQVTLAYLGGERDFDHLRRHFINSRATTVGQVAAFTWGGADGMSYNEEHGIWVAQGIDRVPGGKTGFTSGSIMMTDATSTTYGDGSMSAWEGFVAHEAAHAEQAARFGGGPFWAAVYLEGWQAAGYDYGDNVFEQEAERAREEAEEAILQVEPGANIPSQD